MKMSPEEWISKADWEGGFPSAILEYGLNENHLDREADREFYDLVAKAAAASVDFDNLIKYAGEHYEY